MDADSFTDLALRVISGETTDNERQSLEAEFSAHPERREEFQQLKITHDILRTTAPMTEAAKATEPALPAYRMGELRTAVRQHFGPAARSQKTANAGGFFSALRWVFAGSGATLVAVAVIVVMFSNRSIEVGVYGTDLVRGEDAPLTAQDIPSARLVTFEKDTPFDQWQSQPLAWYEHAKIWVDNEHDLLHIVRRPIHGEIMTVVQPLAPTTQGQRDQIKQVVENLKKQ